MCKTLENQPSTLITLSSVTDSQSEVKIKFCTLSRDIQKKLIYHQPKCEIIKNDIRQISVKC